MGKRRQGGVRAGGSQLGRGDKKERRMAFLKTKLLSDEDMELSEEDLKMVIDASCLLLLHAPSNRDFKGHCGTVFNDWDVLSETGEKGLPSCDKGLFGRESRQN